MSLFSSSSIDPHEIDNFESLARNWWQPKGTFWALHALNLPRLQFIRQQIMPHFKKDDHSPKPYTDLAIIDIGCGGGILSEPLARCGAHVTGIDAGAQTIEVARRHATQQDLVIDYRLSTAEMCAARGEQYDVVIAMEIVEHVANVAGFMASVSQLTKPHGLVILSTLNRTLKSYAMAILGAEYILRMIPRGTHTWQKFLTPAEMARHCRSTGLMMKDIQGFRFRPLSWDFVLNSDVDINYILCAQKITPEV